MFDRINDAMYWDKGLRLVEGCNKVSEGCDHCWAMEQTHMRKHQKNKLIREQYPFDCTSKDGEWTGNIYTLHQNIDIPRSIKKPTVFSVWNDLFHEKVPDEYINWVFTMMKECPQHIFLVLTKRPENALKWFNSFGWIDIKKGYDQWMPKNMWLGVTVENQKEAEKRIPILLQIPAAKRFVSIEPMLGSVHLSDLYIGVDHELSFIPQDHDHIDALRSGIDWVICGGETGSKARTCKLDWVRSVQYDCLVAETTFYFKQWGQWLPWEINPDLKSIKSQSGKIHKLKEYTKKAISKKLGKNWKVLDYYLVQRVSRKVAGRKLDGKEYNGIPAI